MPNSNNQCNQLPLSVGQHRVGIAMLALLVTLLCSAGMLACDAAFELASTWRWLFWMLLAGLFGLTVYLVFSRVRGVTSMPLSVVCLAMLASLGTIVTLPASRGHVRRLVFPWSERPAAGAEFRIEVTSKDITASSDQQITLSGFLVPLHPLAKLPATITYHDEEQTINVPVRLDGSFVIQQPARNMSYWFQLPGTASERYLVHTIHSLTWLPSSSIWIDPPPYAVQAEAPRRTIAFPQLLNTPERLEVLAGSRLVGTIHTAESIVTARVQLAGEPSPHLHVEPSEISWSIPVDHSGELVVEVQSVNGKRGRLMMSVVALPDQPPFAVAARAWRTPQQFQLQPGSQLVWPYHLRDDVALASLAIEWLVPAPSSYTAPVSVAQTLPLRYKSTTEASGVAMVRPPDSAIKHAKFRMVIKDAAPSPHTVYLPENGWHELEITPNALPFTEQTIRQDQALWEKHLRTEIEQLELALRLMNRTQALGAEREALDLIESYTQFQAKWMADYLGEPAFTKLLENYQTSRDRLGSVFSLLVAELAKIEPTRLDPLRERCAQAVYQHRLVCLSELSRLPGVSERRRVCQAIDEALAAIDDPVEERTNRQTFQLLLRQPILRDAYNQACLVEWSAAQANLIKLYATHQAWWNEYHEFQKRTKIARASTVRERFDLLVLQIHELDQQTAEPSQVLGLPKIAPGWAKPIEDAFSQVPSLMLLTELEKAAIAFEELARRREQAFHARRHPREALRQLQLRLNELQRRAESLDQEPEAITQQAAEALEFYRAFEERSPELVTILTNLAAMPGGTQARKPTHPELIDALRQACAIAERSWQGMFTAEEQAKRNQQIQNRWKLETVLLLANKDRVAVEQNHVPDPLPSTDFSWLSTPEAQAECRSLDRRAREEWADGFKRDALKTLAYLSYQEDQWTRQTTANITEAEQIQRLALAQQELWVGIRDRLATPEELLPEQSRLLRALPSSIRTCEWYHSRTRESLRRAEASLKQPDSTTEQCLAEATHALQTEAAFLRGALSDWETLQHYRTGIGQLFGPEARLHRRLLRDAVEQLRFGPHQEIQKKLLVRIEQPERKLGPNQQQQAMQNLEDEFDHAIQQLASYGRARQSSVPPGPPGATEPQRLLRARLYGLPTKQEIDQFHAVALSLRQLRDQLSEIWDDSRSEPLLAKQIQAWQDFRNDTAAVVSQLTELQAHLAAENLLVVNRPQVQHLSEFLKMSNPEMMNAALLRPSTALQHERTCQFCLLRACFTRPTTKSESLLTCQALGDLLRVVEAKMRSNQVQEISTVMREIQSLIYKYD